MEWKCWEDSGSSNFELTPPWLQKDALAPFAKPGIASVSGGYELDAVGAFDELTQQLERGAVDFSNSSDAAGIEAVNELTRASVEISEGDPLLGVSVGVNQDIDLFDLSGRSASLDLPPEFNSASAPQQAAQLAFENGFERGFDKGFEKGLRQQPKSTIFQNVQFAGGFAEFVGGDMVGGTINNLSPFLSEKWKEIERELLDILSSLSIPSDFNSPEANFNKASGVFNEVSKDADLYQKIVDFKGALRVNGLQHQSTNRVINIVLASF